MEKSEYLTATERLYGLSLIWQEANYNFAFFDRVPNLDWDASYREYIPQVIAAKNVWTYYDLLSKFTALLKDGHIYIVSPKSLYFSLDRPKLTLMNIGNTPIVTNAVSRLGSSVPIGSELLEIDGVAVKDYLTTRIIPAVCETTPHRLYDHAVARLLLGTQGSKVHCKFDTPGGKVIELELERNRFIDTDPWLRPYSVPYKWEFMYSDEKFLGEASFTPYDFRILGGNVAYVALNTFKDPTVATSFTEDLPKIRECSGIILDLRKNHGGSDATGYSIVSNFIHQPTDMINVQSPKHIASYKASGKYLRDTPEHKVRDLPTKAREQLLCYKKQWVHKAGWGTVQPVQEILDNPTVILTSSETGSAAEDFVMAIQSGKGEAIRMGRSTGGSTGQPLTQELPGGGRFAICTVRMDWPHKIWRKGIEPHILVEPTVEDVIRNEDHVLNTAVRYLHGDEIQKS